MHTPAKRRRRKAQTRDTLDGSEEGSEDDVGYMNTRESHSDNQGRLFSASVSPQKKSTKQRWATRRVWDPPEDLELGLDTDSKLYDRVVEAEVYDAPEVEPVHRAPRRKQRRTLRTVGILLTRFKRRLTPL